MARELSIDLSQVSGSGKGGRILIDDLASFVKSTTPSDGSAKPATAANTPSLTASYSPGSRLKLQGLRRKVAEQMVRSKQTVPHYSYIDECDVTELVRLRESLKEHFLKSNVKLTYLAFLVKAVTAALKEVPLVNATLEDESGRDCDPRPLPYRDRRRYRTRVGGPGDSRR